MSEDMGNRETRTRAAGVAASAPSHSCGVEQQLILHVSKGNRGRELEKTAYLGHFGAKWCIWGVPFLFAQSCNLISCQSLRISFDLRHNASPTKNQKSGAFWCILVHGERKTREIRRISGVGASNGVSRMHGKVVH